MRYVRGDELILKIEENFGYKDLTVRHVKVQIIAHNVISQYDEAEYLVYVPPYEHLSGTWRLTLRDAQRYQVDKKFIDDDVIFIDPYHPISKHIPSIPGAKCDHCNEFFAGAVPEGDGTYWCRACRHNPYR
jgi:hypothetical protein